MGWQDSRYGGDTWTEAEDKQAKADVSEAMRKLFGDGRTLAADSWTVGGMAYIHENGMPMSATRPRESPAWQRRFDKAKREIEEHSTEIRVRELAAAITIEEIQNDLQEIRRWVNSLQNRQEQESVSGSIVSTQHATG